VRAGFPAKCDSVKILSVNSRFFPQLPKNSGFCPETHLKKQAILVRMKLPRVSGLM
jgi:hypothetical protein